MNLAESTLCWRYYGGRNSLVAIAVALFLGTIFLFVGYFVRQTEEEYGKYGQPATATVTRKDKRTEQPVAGQKGGPKTIHTVFYRYQDAQGQSHDGNDSVDANVWNQTQKDQPLQIEYLSNQTNKSRIAVGRSFFARWGYVLALGGGSFLVGCVLVFGLGGWFWAARKARLVRNGVPFLGIITEHVSRAWGRGNQESSYRLCFTFTDAEGAERSGKSFWLSRDLMPRWPVNEPILVLQDSANPARFEADVYEARAEDLARFQDI